MLLASLLFDDRHPCDPRGGRKSATWWLIVPLALLGLVLAGCSTTPRCEELSRCGGDLLAGATSAPGATVTESEWVSGAADACMDQVQLPIVPVSLSQQPAPKIGKKAPAPATVDWCSSLSQKPDGSLRYTPFFPIIPLKNAHLKLKSDGTYDAHFTAFEPQHLAFSAACRAAQGINVSCAELGRHIKEAIAAEANVYNTRCYDDSDGAGGCTCDYDLTLFTSLPGVWSQSSDGIVTFYDQSLAPSAPAPADYCLKSDSLEMTGHHGQQLFNRPDLRTLVFHRPSCNDGLQDSDETGVDCGPVCGNTCGTCSDNKQNQDETGVDCGASCPDFCGCFNGVQDPWEEGVDCGGPCSLLCTCTDGKHDGNEPLNRKKGGQIDCGGDCQKRFSDDGPIPCPTCDDGIQNQDETGVDCGGSICDDVCTCFNGAKDAGEEGVDCGGPCALACTCTNGVHDDGEVDTKKADAIDCGPMCVARFGDKGPIIVKCPTCDDGVQNQDETGVDCGGKVCKDDCACFNKVQDAGEEGVDCGGPCALLCSCTNGVHDADEGDSKRPDGIDCGGKCQARLGDGSGGVIPCQ